MYSTTPIKTSCPKCNISLSVWTAFGEFSFICDQCGYIDPYAGTQTIDKQPSIEKLVFALFKATDYIGDKEITTRGFDYWCGVLKNLSETRTQWAEWELHLRKAINMFLIEHGKN